MGSGPHTLLGQLLLSYGMVSESDLAEALRRQEISREPVGQILVAMGVVGQREVELALRAQARLRGRADQGRSHLLVVDDETEVGAIVGDILSGAGYSVSIAQSAEEAEAALTATDTVTPSLILLDLNMPGKSGLELLPTLTQLVGRPVPVVVLTGRGDLEEQVRALSPQVRAFLPKPIGARDLVRAVDAVLNEAPVPAA